MNITESVQAFVDELGALSGRRAVTAAEAIRLAGLLDLEDGGTAAAALSRELRLVMASLEPVGALPAALTGPHEDAVTKVRDEVAKKRRQRAARQA